MPNTNVTDRIPDFRLPTPLDRIPEGGMLSGQVDGAPVLLLRRGALCFAVGGTCPHYGAPLSEGLLSGDTLHCPHHHACFDVRTGRPQRGPALTPLPRYRVERHLDTVCVVGEPLAEVTARPPYIAEGRPAPARIVIVGTGAGGVAAAFALRSAGYAGQLTLIGDESVAPYDRPTLSKGYLAGTASGDWLPLQPDTAYVEREIRLMLGTPVTRIDTATGAVWLADGRTFPFDRLLIAPGAVAVRPELPGLDQSRVITLRRLADVDRLRDLTAAAGHAVVIGAGFLGLEAAASLRARGLAVDVVTPDAVPLQKVLGAELGRRVQRLHEEHGVRMHLGRSVTEIGQREVMLDDRIMLPADLVVVATGVRPDTRLAERAGLALDRGIRVDRYLETSHPGIFAAGDAVRWPDPRSGEYAGCGHWSLAMRMGETAACNMLGALSAFDAVPFFWSEHYDLRINCSGSTDRYDRIEVRGGLPNDQWEQRYWCGDRLVAVATINRDHASLEAELALERQLAPAHAARLGGVTARGQHR